MNTNVNTKDATTTRILPAINEPVNKVTSIIKVFEDGHHKVMSAMADWLDLALEMPPTQDGVPLVTAIMQYELNNACQQAWSAHYGNRTLDEIKKGLVTEADPKAIWCAEQRLAYTETIWFGESQTNGQYEVATGNRETGLAQQEEGMHGPSLEKQQALTNYMLASLNYARTKAMLDAAMEAYDFIVGQPYVYEKFERKTTVRAASAEAASKAAAILAARKKQ